MSVVYVVVEDAGYDVGRVVEGVFSTREKADNWVEAKQADAAREVRKGNGVWHPYYEVEERPFDPETEVQAP